MDTSAGVTLRLLFLALVVLGMPFLALPDARRTLAAWQRPGGHSTWESSRSRIGWEPDWQGEADEIAAPQKQVSASTAWDARRASATRESSPPSPDRMRPWEADREGRVELALSVSLQRRLEELGAEYLMVERLEVSGLYRCVCLVDVPGTGYQRPFEAADLLPERAVQRVLDELQSWRLAVSQPRNSDAP
jgi:hypothetical protein